MDFLVLREDLSLKVISVVIQRGSTTLFYVKLPVRDNKINVWLSILKHLYLLPNTEPDREQLYNLLDAIPLLLTLQVPDDTYQTYLHILQALLNLLEVAKDLTKQYPGLDDLTQEYSDLHELLERFLFQFEVESPGGNRYTAIFSCLGAQTWKVPLQYDHEIFLTEVSQASLAASCKKPRGRQNVVHFLENHLRFQSVIAGQARMAAETHNDAEIMAMNQKIKAFSSLSRALITLIDQDVAGLRVYISLIPNICAFLVKNELEDLETQKIFLERLLNSRESAEKKRERLEDIVQDIKDDITKTVSSANSVEQRKAGETRLIQVISLISDHYLRLYELNSSVDFWAKIKNKDVMLQVLLLLHKRPWVYLVVQGFALGVLFTFALQHPHIPEHFPSPFNPLNPDWRAGMLKYYPLAPLLVWYVPLLILLVASISELFRKRKRWLYTQLLLPRLLGAVIVGLLPLLFNDESWLIGIQGSWISLSLFFLLACLGSFAYILFEVNNTMKFVRGHPLEKNLKVSVQIFFIALSEALFIVTITTTLVFPPVSSILGIRDLNDKLGIIANVGGGLPPVGVFPLLILLWSGIVLFIGSFVQLLWQDRRITDTV